MLTEKQIKQRRRGLGGSDSAVILGASPWVTLQDLWADKMGLTKSSPPSPAMERGNYLEPVAAEKYSAQTGRKVQRESRTLYYRKNKLFFGHIDRRILPDKVPLEIKCPGLRVFSQCKREGLPAYYQIQAQHYMMVMDAPWASIAVFNAEAWEMFTVDIQRDEEIIEMIRSKGEEFWQRHVETGVAPMPSAVAEPALDLPPLPTGQELIRLDTSEWAEAVSELREAKLLKEAVEGIELSARERVIRLLSDLGANCIEGAGARIYYQEQQGRESFDLKGFRRTHPELESEIQAFMKRGRPYKVLRPYWIDEKRMIGDA